MHRIKASRIILTHVRHASYVCGNGVCMNVCRGRAPNDRPNETPKKRAALYRVWPYESGKLGPGRQLGGVEAARADQRAFVRSDAVDPRDQCACHLRWHGSGSASPLRAVENADVLLNIHDPYTIILTERA